MVVIGSRAIGMNFRRWRRWCRAIFMVDYSWRLDNDRCRMFDDYRRWRWRRSYHDCLRSNHLANQVDDSCCQHQTVIVVLWRSGKCACSDAENCGRHHKFKLSVHFVPPMVIVCESFSLAFTYITHKRQIYFIKFKQMFDFLQKNYF